MGTLSRVVGGLAAALCAAGAVQVHAGPEGPQPYDRWLPRSGPDRVVSFVVVDADGRPVEGARISRHARDPRSRVPVPRQLGIERSSFAFSSQVYQGPAEATTSREVGALAACRGSSRRPLAHVSEAS